MENMNGWDIAVLVVAGYVAATTLVRLMVRRRDQLLGEFRRQLKREKQRKEAKELEEGLLRRPDKAA